MKEKLLALRPHLVRWVGYPLFFFFWFVVFVYATFPYDRLKDKIIAEVETPRPTLNGAAQVFRLDIESLGPTLLPGLHARGVTLRIPGSRPGEPESVLRMDDVRARVGILALLFKSIEASVDVTGLGGELDTRVEMVAKDDKVETRALRMTFEHVDAAQVPQLAQMVGLPVAGTIDGSIDLRVPDGRTDRASGDINLTIDGLRIGDGHAQYQVPGMGGLTIERIDAGRFETRIQVRDGVATIDRFRATGSDLRLVGDGRLELRAEPGQSVVNTGIRFQLTDAYKRKSDQARAITTAMEMVPDLRNARRPDGMMAFRCRGSLDRMSCLPEGGRAPAGGARR